MTESVASYLTNEIRKSRKTQKEIAREAGFPTPNILSMIKSGETKMPLARVPALSEALDVPPQEMLRRCLAEYDPELLRVIDMALPIALLSDAEIDLIRALRSVVSAA